MYRAVHARLEHGAARPRSAERQRTGRDRASKLSEAAAQAHRDLKAGLRVVC